MEIKRRLRALTGRTEFYILIVYIALCLLIQLRSGSFFELNNLTDILSALIVPCMFALGEFAVIVSGGVDVSFPALASLSSYITAKLLLDCGRESGLWLPILLTVALGALLGAFNGLFIGVFELPAMIVTLGTASVFKGFMQAALSAKQLSVLPACMKRFGSAALFTAVSPSTGLKSPMPAAVIFLAVTIAAAYFLLNRTMFGRGIYAIGGNPVSAHRAGFNVKRTRFLTMVFAGVTAALAGFCRTCMMQQMHPTNMLGMEMNIIAGVVLGGTALVGGRGSLTGCVLGVLLIVTMENSMILIGIPTVWKDVFVGALIILGTSFSALRARKGVCLSGRAVQ